MWSKTKIALRWLACLPVAFFAALLAGPLVEIVNRVVGIIIGRDYSSPLTILGIFTVFAAMGVVFILVGVLVAPAHRRVVAFSLAGLGCLYGGFSAYSSFITADYQGVWAWASFLIGIGFMIYGGWRDGDWDSYID